MDASALFGDEIRKLWSAHRPSSHAFFSELRAVDTECLRVCLDDLYARYQAAMHATRVMVYFIPHLDTIDLRMAKMKVLADDDGIEGGDSHHYQLRRTWTFMLGRSPAMCDSEFGELEPLAQRLDRDTAAFVLRVRELYPNSLGPWVMVEGLAHDWIGALLLSLKSHFPGVEETDYFRENFSSCVEIRHAHEAFELTAKVIADHPNLLAETIDGAKSMGKALDTLWSGMGEVLRGRLSWSRA